MKISLIHNGKVIRSFDDSKEPAPGVGDMVFIKPYAYKVQQRIVCYTTDPIEIDFVLVDRVVP